jgi:hypothetical protein
VTFPPGRDTLAIQSQGPVCSRSWDKANAFQVVARAPLQCGMQIAEWIACHLSFSGRVASTSDYAGRGPLGQPTYCGRFTFRVD